MDNTIGYSNGGNYAVAEVKAMSLIERVAVLEKRHSEEIGSLHSVISRLTERIGHLERELGTSHCFPPEGPQPRNW